jgi:hypothetical protein
MGLLYNYGICFDVRFTSGLGGWQDNTWTKASILTLLRGKYHCSFIDFYETNK